MIRIEIKGADGCRQDLLKTAVINHLRANNMCKGVEVTVTEGQEEEPAETRLELWQRGYDGGYKNGYRQGCIDGQVLPSTNHRSIM